VRSSKGARSYKSKRGAHPDFALPPPAATFLSATQIESIGGAIYPVVSGNFNGDALPDIVTLFQDAASPTGTYLAVLLNMSNGSFGGPVLTPVTFATGNFILVGDVNNDGKDDVVLVLSELDRCADLDRRWKFCGATDLHDRNQCSRRGEPLEPLPITRHWTS
jgi:hypothetical protein